MRRLALLVLVFPLACVKKMDPSPTPNQRQVSLLEEICRVEIERHGEGVLVSGFVQFGNKFMDDYLAEPLSPHVLWSYFLESTGVCRGALLQLMVTQHPDYLRSHWKSLDDTLADPERRLLLDLMRETKDPQWGDLIAHYLIASSDSEVRRAAAMALAIVDQPAFREVIAQGLASESDPEIIAAILFSLDLESYPELNGLLERIAPALPAAVHETVMMIWSTSSLAGKRELIAGYLQHTDKNLRDMARHLLDRLDQPGEKLQWQMVQKPEMLGMRAKQTESQAAPDPQLNSDYLVAIRSNDREAIALLLQKGLDLNHTMERGFTYFERALFIAEPSMIEFLLEHGADIHLRNNGTNNTLMLAARDCQVGGPEKIQMLIARGMDVNAQNSAGETALIRAVMANKLDHVQILIEMGADPDLRDHLGRTALSVARLMEHDGIADYLTKR